MIKSATAGTGFSAGRLGRIVAGYLLGSVVAGGIIGLPLWYMFSTFGPLAFMITVPAVPILALVPAIIFIPIAERRGIRSAFAYIVAGAVVGLLWGAVLTLGSPGTFVLYSIGLTAFAGAVAGVVYHLVAGRTAGG